MKIIIRYFKSFNEIFKRSLNYAIANEKEYKRLKKLEEEKAEQEEAALAEAS